MLEPKFSIGDTIQNKEDPTIVGVVYKIVITRAIEKNRDDVQVVYYIQNSGCKDSLDERYAVKLRSWE